MAPDTRVNCVAPGFVPTHFADYITKNEAVVGVLCLNCLAFLTSTRSIPDLLQHIY